MSHNRRLLTLGVVLLFIATVIPGLALGAWAQSNYKTLHKFKAGPDGYEPTARLVFDQAGNLYGTSGAGGVHNGGAVFKLTPKVGGGWTASVLYMICARKKNCGGGGTGPAAGLIFDQAGNLYGTIMEGGGNLAGTVFKLTHNEDGSWSESDLYTFCSLANCSDGLGPWAGLIFDQAGNLYGTTRGGGSSSTCFDGCGTVFKLTPNSDGSWSESVLYSFCSQTGCSDGSSPYFVGLISDHAGNLYGTTGAGGSLTQCQGSGGCGVVFELTPNADGSWNESVLHTFCSRSGCEDGVAPLEGVIFDQAGNLYGTTVDGGAYNSGTVFKLSPNGDGSWKESVLHSFTGGKDGWNPKAGLIFDQAGNLYGTTSVGGDHSYCYGGGCGVVFKLAPNSNGGWRETVLHTFRDNPGALPAAGVIFDAAGNLYGTTYGDSSTTSGSVFEIMP